MHTFQTRQALRLPRGNRISGTFRQLVRHARRVVNHASAGVLEAGRWIAVWRQERRMIRLMQTLDERVLADIGIVPSAIPFVIRSSAPRRNDKHGWMREDANWG